MLFHWKRLRSAALALSLIVCSLMLLAQLSTAESAVNLPAPANDLSKVEGTSPQNAVLAGGCFWGVQGVFEHVRGVQQVVAGYAGGDKGSANYDSVSGGNTGHAESVQIRFDPQQISFGEILRIYFSVAHDPTQHNRQGPDTGSQYRSVIFYANDQQKDVAQAYIAQLNKSKAFKHTIETQVEPLRGFYPAEDYHQDFLVKHPAYPYIVVNDLPKIQNLKRLFPQEYLDQPVTLGG